MLRDPNTLSNYDSFRTVNTQVSYAIDFDQRVLRGNVLLDLVSTTNAESKEILLDTSHLDIQDVKLGGHRARWEIMPEVKIYGSPLKINLDQGVERGESVELDIAVATTAGCTALQWLTPAQTSNKKHPYLFSQCQAIHARSCYPCQDTPDVKSTFTFALRSPLPVFASGIPYGEDCQVLNLNHWYMFRIRPD